MDKLEGMASALQCQSQSSGAILLVPLPCAWHVLLGWTGSSPTCSTTARSGSLHWHMGGLFSITEVAALALLTWSLKHEPYNNNVI